MGKNKKLGCAAIDIQVENGKIDRRDKINSSRQLFWIYPLTSIGKVGKIAVMEKGVKK